VGQLDSLNHFLVHYADSLTDNAQDRMVVASGSISVRYLDYDWRLNVKITDGFAGCEVLFWFA